MGGRSGQAIGAREHRRHASADARAVVATAAATAVAAVSAAHHATLARTDVGVAQNHRTEVEHTYGLARKLVIFSAVVSYCAIYFLALVYVPFGQQMSRLVSNLMDVSHDFSVGPDRISHQLSTVLITGQILSFVNEVREPARRPVRASAL